MTYIYTQVSGASALSITCALQIGAEGVPVAIAMSGVQHLQLPLPPTAQNMRGKQSISGEQRLSHDVDAAGIKQMIECTDIKLFQQQKS